MDDEQFAQWTQLLEQRTGMVLPLARKSFLVTSVSLRMKEIGCACFNQYFKQVSEGARGLIEWSTLVDRLTVHETRFFRQPCSLDLVRETVLAKVRRETAKVPSIQVWSVGCATGEEPYSLAMVIDDALASHDFQAYYGILATDISQPSLATARKAIYHERRVKNVPPEFLARYLTQVEDRYEVCERLRKLVCFMRMNIMDQRSVPGGKLDIIYCQNVLIYFDRAKREAMVNGLAERLHPGGLLVLGSGELVGWRHPAMHKVDCGQALAYRRVEVGATER